VYIICVSEEGGSMLKKQRFILLLVGMIFGSLFLATAIRADEEQPAKQETEEEKISRAKQEKRIIPGMTEADVIDILGMPSRMDTRNDGTNRWYYIGFTKTTVYFYNGKVKKCVD